MCKARLGLARVTVVRGEGPSLGTPAIDDHIRSLEPITDYLTKWSGLVRPQPAHCNPAFHCCAGLCCAILSCAELCCAVLCCAVLCCSMLRCVVLRRAVLCCAVLCCAVLCCAVLCCAVLKQPYAQPSCLLVTIVESLKD